MSRAAASMPSRPRLNQVILWGIVASAVAVSYWAVRSDPPLGDEGYHLSEIHLLVHGQWTVAPNVVMLPGYHILLAAAAWAAGTTSLPFLRAVTAGLSLLTIVALDVLTRTIDESADGLPTLEFTFLAIVFPLFALIYTDVAGLLFVLLCVTAALRERPGAATAFGLYAVVVRQTNIVWVMFAFALMWWKSCPAIVAGWRRSAHSPTALRAAVIRALNVVWPVALMAGLSVGFIAVNGGVAIHRKAAYPFPSFHLGDIFFALMILPALFLPPWISALPRIWRLLRTSRIWWGVLPACFALYMATFTASHPFNQPILSYFLRNRVLAYATSSAARKAACFLPIAWSLLVLAVTPLRRSSFRLLYPFAALSLVPLWLIEQRYFIVPIALFLCMRAPDSRRVAWMQVGYGMLVTAALFIPLVHRTFFL